MPGLLSPPSLTASYHIHGTAPSHQKLEIWCHCTFHETLQLSVALGKKSDVIAGTDKRTHTQTHVQQKHILLLVLPWEQQGETWGRHLETVSPLAAVMGSVSVSIRAMPLLAPFPLLC